MTSEQLWRQWARDQHLDLGGLERLDLPLATGCAGQEEPFFFPSGGDVLVGIVTHPLAEGTALDEGTSVDVLLASGGWLGLSTGQVVHHWEIWRLVTYGFCHNIHDPWHVGFNMLGLGRDQWETARDIIEESLMLFREVGSR